MNSNDIRISHKCYEQFPNPSNVSEAMFAGGRFVESREAEIEIPQWSHVAFSAMLVPEPRRSRRTRWGLDKLDGLHELAESYWQLEMFRSCTVYFVTYGMNLSDLYDRVSAFTAGINMIQRRSSRILYACDILRHLVTFAHSLRWAKEWLYKGHAPRELSAEHLTEADRRPETCHSPCFAMLCPSGAARVNESD